MALVPSSSDLRELHHMRHITRGYSEKSAVCPPEKGPHRNWPGWRPASSTVTNACSPWQPLGPRCAVTVPRTDQDSRAGPRPGGSRRPLTHEVHLGAVAPEVPLIGVGRVALVLPRIPGLQLRDVQQGRVVLDSLHVDLATADALGVDGVREGRVHRADDLDLALRRGGQVNGPLEILLGGALVATHVAPDGDVGALRAVQRSLLDGDLPLSCHLTYAGDTHNMLGEFSDQNAKQAAIVKGFVICVPWEYK